MKPPSPTIKLWDETYRKRISLGAAWGISDLPTSLPRHIYYTPMSLRKPRTGRPSSPPSPSSTTPPGTGSATGRGPKSSTSSGTSLTSAVVGFSGGFQKAGRGNGRLWTSRYAGCGRHSPKGRTDLSLDGARTGTTSTDHYAHCSNVFGGTGHHICHDVGLLQPFLRPARTWRPSESPAAGKISVRWPYTATLTSNKPVAQSANYGDECGEDHVSDWRKTTSDSVDIVGVAGSIPAAPTTIPLRFKRFSEPPDSPIPAASGSFRQNLAGTCGENTGRMCPVRSPPRRDPQCGQSALRLFRISAWRTK